MASPFSRTLKTPDILSLLTILELSNVSKPCKPKLTLYLDIKSLSPINLDDTKLTLELLDLILADVEILTLAQEYIEALAPILAFPPTLAVLNTTELVNTAIIISYYKQVYGLLDNTLPLPFLSLPPSVTS